MRPLRLRSTVVDLRSTKNGTNSDIMRFASCNSESLCDIEDNGEIDNVRVTYEYARLNSDTLGDSLKSEE